MDLRKFGWRICASANTSFLPRQTHTMPKRPRFSSLFWGCFWALLGQAHAQSVAPVLKPIDATATPVRFPSQALVHVWGRLCNEPFIDPTIAHENIRRLLVVETCSNSRVFLGRVDLWPTPKVVWSWELPAQPDVNVGDMKLGPDVLDFEGAGEGGFVLRSRVLHQFVVVTEDGHFQKLEKFAPFQWGKKAVPSTSTGVATMAGRDIYRVEYGRLNVIRMGMDSGTVQIVGTLPKSFWRTPFTYALRFVDTHQRYLAVLSNDSSRISANSRVIIFDTQTGQTRVKRNHRASLPKASSFIMDEQGCLHIQTHLNSGKVVDEVVRPCAKP